MSETRTPTVEGTLDRYPLPRLLYYLYKKAFVGELEVQPEVGTIRVFFREGLPVRCDVPSFDDVLGQVLLERGWITQEAFHRSLEELAKGGRLQGQILLSIGALTEQQLVEGLCLQLRRKLYRVFSLTSAPFALYGGDHPHGVEAEALHVRADPLWVIYQGVRNTYDAQRLMRELERIDEMAVGLRPEFVKVAERYGLADEDRALVEMLTRGFLPLAQVFQVSNLGPVQTQMLLYTFWVTEVLVARPAEQAIAATRPDPASLLPSQAVSPPQSGEVAAPIGGPLSGEIVVPPAAETVHLHARVAPAEAPAAQRAAADKPVATQSAEEREKVRLAVQEVFSRMKAQNHFEVLGVARTASPDLVRDAYFKLAKQYHPDRVHGLGIEELTEQAEGIFRMINEAHQVLTDKQLREKYEAKLDGQEDDDGEARAIVEAELAFQKGMVQFRKRQFAPAREHFARAVELAPKEGEHLAWLAWTDFTDPGTDRRSELPKLKQRLLEAISLSPKNAVCHHYLGEIYLALDDTARAQTCFNKVLELNPRHIDAKRHLHLIRARKDKDGGKGKGLFGKLRKR